MIYQKDLKDYNFQSIWDYQNYILESKINGQYSQVERLIKDMSLSQRFEFIENLASENSLSESDLTWFIAKIKDISTKRS